MVYTFYPTEDQDDAWNLRKMGSNWVGGRGRAQPPGKEQDKQLTASRGGDKCVMEREEDGKKGQA
jgi:hypothetical protein